MADLSNEMSLDTMALATFYSYQKIASSKVFWILQSLFKKSSSLGLTRCRK